MSFCLFLVLGINPKASFMLRQVLYQSATPPVPSCKYFTKQLYLSLFNSFRPFLPRPLLSLLVKSRTRPVGRALREHYLKGERYYWNLRLISPMVIFLPVLITFSARLCSLLLTPLKIAMSANIHELLKLSLLYLLCVLPS